MPTRSRPPWLGSVALVALVAVASNLGAMAINAATAADRWPGWLDLIRRSPFLSAGILTFLSVALTVGIALRDRKRTGDGTRTSRKSLPPVIEKILNDYDLGTADEREGITGRRRERLRGVKFRQQVKTDQDGTVHETTELSIEEISYIPLRQERKRDV
jgi:hypothetical protein